MANQPAGEIPVIERWDTHSLDLTDPKRRFKVSRWNYFLKDPATGVVMGYWEAEQGYEDLGQGGDFDEVMHVVLGRLYVACEGQELVANPGDTVIIQRDRPTRIMVREPVRVFFICYPMPDIAGYEADIRAGRYPGDQK
jgi:ethanolamine utilization protein EutQ (cupin superfamily)